MGWWPAGDGSTIDNRVWTSPTFPTTSMPRSSGPRWPRASAMRSSAPLSGRAPGSTTHPAMPHMARQARRLRQQALFPEPRLGAAHALVEVHFRLPAEDLARPGHRIGVLAIEVAHRLRGDPRG